MRLKNEIKILFTAIMFYTRIPMPKSTGFSPENLNKATKYFPLVGIIVGGVGALAFVLSNILFSQSISILFCIVSMILLTGAFHEDALSDFCDGFGGGYTKEKILTIMKDSQIGTYGGLSLVILILSKLVLISEFEPVDIPVILVSAHSLSRVNPVILIFTSQYVREDITSKSKPVGEKASLFTLITAIIFGVLPLAFVSVYIIPFLLITLSLIFVYFRYYVHKHLGGYTGDILGALQQFSEIGFYLAYLAAINIL